MKKISFLLILFMASSCEKEELKNTGSTVKIPDVNFEKSLIELKIDDVQDGELLRANAEKVEDLYLSRHSLKTPLSF